MRGPLYFLFRGDVVVVVEMLAEMVGRWLEWDFDGGAGGVVTLVMGTAEFCGMIESKLCCNMTRLDGYVCKGWR